MIRLLCTSAITRYSRTLAAPVDTLVCQWGRCYKLISTGLERLEWNEDYTRGRSSHSKLFVSILNLQATEQPTRTANNPTDLCGGTAQLHPKTGVPSRGQRVLLTHIITFHANIAQGKPQTRRC